mmetsp:Transcript_66682/g.171705  ORF Transcript_66682/g.171705 Transcript_66682/m.171705 type:complete len:222 (+) Transcript_66682:2540-3205(+)
MEKCSTKETVATSCSKRLACSTLTGKLSIRKRLVSVCFCMLTFSSGISTVSGTGLPVVMCFSISVPRYVSAAISVFIRSGMLRRTKLNSSASLVQYSTVPDSGPPTTKTTYGGLVMPLAAMRLFSSFSPETSTSITRFCFGSTGASTAKGMPSVFTPYSTTRFVRSGGLNFLPPTMAFSLLGSFSESQRLSHFTASRPLGCTWHSAMRPCESSCCSVGSTE